MKYSELEKDMIFDRIWSYWPNKNKGEHAPRKALSVALNSGHNHKKIEEACRIYSLLSEGDDPKYIKRLNNFLNEDEWLDVLEYHSLEALEDQRKKAIEVIQYWNEKSRSHWCKILSEDEKVPLAKAALQNESFEKNWKKSLDIASEIFQHSFNESDSRSKIILSFRWFCNVSSDKHTVLKILEGEYGFPKKNIKRYKTGEWKDQDPEEQKEAVKNFKEIFKDFDLKPIKKPWVNNASKNKQAEEIAKQITEGFNSLVETCEGSEKSGEDDSFGFSLPSSGG